jgi:transposase
VDLPSDHLARMVEAVVEESIGEPEKAPGPGQPPFDPRLCVKVLVYGYATGVRSSRQLEKLCDESLPYLFLTRGDTPSYRTLCSARVDQADILERVWLGLFSVARGCGMHRLGRIVVDSTKLRANTGSESVLRQDEYAAMKIALKEIVAEAEATDKREDSEGYAGETRTGKKVEKLQMRDIIRKMRKDLSEMERAESKSVTGSKVDEHKESPRITRRMGQRAQKALKAIEDAEAKSLKHLSLTDPDARMMLGGVEKKVHECHSLEVAIDRDSGLLVAGDVTQIGPDQNRLTPLVESAKKNEPCGIKAVDGDSGYYRSADIAALINSGVDVCIPDPYTASELHRGLKIGSISSSFCSASFQYDCEHDRYVCPEGNTLTFRGRKEMRGDDVKLYQASRGCRQCPRYSGCISSKHAKTKYKSITVRDECEELAVARDRFNDLEHRQRYQYRGSDVETVFGFIRGALGYARWLLRGSERVKSEGSLMRLGYQVRKVHQQWAASQYPVSQAA